MMSEKTRPTSKECNFRIKSESSYKKLRSALMEQGIPLQDFFNNVIEEYLLKLEDKSVSLNDFIDNPDFAKFPPIPFTHGEINRNSWKKTIESFDQTDPRLKQLEFDLQTVQSIVRKKIKYGTTDVIEH